ncbi:hypothetical protein [Stakelama saccharophila]|uniref:Lipoprotein n=1 Tax=Stakelama saccharophila TaxID=3075605 RepID=A0ABZ0B7V4_9SPHN|nr:hypothetical protein [Stakelama sp. W311]WNO53322.1 hypothetical protein RPR59_12845 [Stakelama sp. W311]
MNLCKPGIAAALLTVPFIAGCSNQGKIDPTGGITAVRTACPRVGVPAGTGDITLFDPANSRLASDIDVTATITNVRANCTDATSDVVSAISFDIFARRAEAGPARDVTLPYFVTVVQGGTSVTAKRVARVTVHFDQGQLRARTSAQGTAIVNRAAATLPQDIRDRITQKRKAGDMSAAVDPLSIPEVRDAVRSATFEALVGFQLTEDQLKYNLTR